MKMFRPGIAIVIAIIMSIILATGSVAASSQQDTHVIKKQFSFELPFSFLQNEGNFNWNELINKIYGQLNLEPKEGSDQQPAEEPKQEEPQKPAEQPKQEEPQQPAEQPQKEEPAEAPKQEQPVEAPKVQEPTEQPSKEQVQEPAQQDESSVLNAFEQEVVDLVNQERQERGLAPLQVSPELSKMARDKSLDMANNNYFSHTSPTYGSPFDMMQQYGIDYRAAGENIAMGQTSPEQVMNGWMNSPGHRKNILSGNFTHIGVGYVEVNGQTYWTQEFIGK